ncbi:MAG: TonB-dependent receptor domain-containing protein [Sphingomonadales bacterium]
MRANRRNLTRSALLSTSAIALLAASVVPASAWAQDEEEVVEEVIVTGSRIRRAGFDTQTPGVQLDSADMDERGFVNIAEALNELPSFGSPGATPENGGGVSAVGQNVVNLYSLGSQRTLVLVNGRRVVSSNAPSINNLTAGLQVDLNAFPTGLVDRIETVSIGGAPVYGSDAIAGTVNVILKKDYEGMQLDAQWGKAEQGLATTRRIRGLFGGNFDDGRGNAVVSVEYNNQDGYNRDQNTFSWEDFSFQPGACQAEGFGRCLTPNLRVQFATHAGLPSVGPGGSALGPARVEVMNPDGTGSGSFLRFGDDGRLTNMDVGIAAGGIFSNGGDGVDLSVLATGRTPLERVILNGNANYQVTDNINAFVETSFYNAKAQSVTSQAGWLVGFFGGGVNEGIEMKLTNPYLHPDDADVLRANNVRRGLPAEDNWYMSRHMDDILLGENSSDLNMFRIVTGLEGEFEMGDNVWNWDVTYNNGQTEVNTRKTQMHQEAFGYATDVVVNPITGEPDCRINVEGIPADPNAGHGVNEPNKVYKNCVPLNLIGLNKMSQEAKDYVTGLGMTHAKLEQQVFSANVSGTLMNTDAGPLGFALGFEHRREYSNFIAGDFLARGLGRSTPVGEGGGSFNTYEIYLETLVPLVGGGEGLPFLKMIASDATIEAAVRNVDHSNAGGAITYTVGGRMSPNIDFLADDLTIRGNITHSIRSPAMVELFTPLSATRGFIQDPCDSGLVDQVATRLANCQALAATLGFDYDPTSFQSLARNGSIFGTTGGNLNLKNEIADSWTAGVVYAPSFMPGLSFQWDWIDIEITDAISNLTGTVIAQSCFDDATYPNDFCGKLSRDSNMQLNFFEAGFLNAGFLNYSGWDLQVRYETEVADIFLLGDVPGNISMNLNWSHIQELSTQATLSASVNPGAGESGKSKNQWNLTTRYANEGFAMSWTVRYKQGGVFDNLNGPKTTNFLTFGSWTNHNTTLSYQINENISARAVVNNVFNQKSPYGNIGIGIYDQLGRAYRIGLTANF